MEYILKVLLYYAYLGDDIEKSKFGHPNCPFKPHTYIRCGTK